jgi:hypothetical protein
VFSADIYLDGKLLLDGFEPSETAGPLRVAAGQHAVDVREIGAAADSAPVVSVALHLRRGSDTSVVAHLSAGNDPTLTLFDNAFDRLPAGRSLLQVRNLGGGGPLSVRLDGRVVGRVAFDGERGITTSAGRHRVAFLSPSGEVRASPTDVDLAEGRALVVYAVGSPGAGDLQLLAQSIGGLRSSPSGVLTGSGGLAAEGPPAWVILVAVASALIVVGLVGELAKARAQGR